MDDDIPQSDCVEGARHPRFAASLVGQSTAENEFLTAFNSGRLHHAWLITGPRGVGKATLAWRIAKFLLSQEDDGADSMFGESTKPTSLDTSPDHPIVRRIAALGEPRLYLARRPYDVKTKKLKSAITVDEIRKLKSFFNMSAADGGWRVAIIDAADELNGPAANALLKILEEPPEKVIILLVCHQPSRMLPTIRSRCRAMRCATLSAPDLQTVLDTSDLGFGQIDPALATLSAGSVGEAIRLQLTDGLKIYTQISAVAANAPNMDRTRALALADSCVGKAAEARYDMVIRLYATFLARLAKYGASQPSVVEEAAPGEAQLFAKLAPSPGDGRKWAQLLQDITDRAQHARAVNLDPSSVILDMLLKLDETARS